MNKITYVDRMGIECSQTTREEARYCRGRPTDRGGSAPYVEGRHGLPLHPGRSRSCCIGTP